MARSKRTLLHRGFLYAQQHGPRRVLTTRPEQLIGSAQRMKLAEAWRAGYTAAKTDARRKKI